MNAKTAVTMLVGIFAMTAFAGCIGGEEDHSELIARVEKLEEEREEQKSQEQQEMTEFLLGLQSQIAVFQSNLTESLNQTGENQTALESQVATLLNQLSTLQTQLTEAIESIANLENVVIAQLQSEVDELRKDIEGTPPPPTITGFTRDIDQNRVIVDQVEDDADWSKIFIKHNDNCSNDDGDGPHLNADGPPLADGDIVGSDKVKVGDYIQVYLDSGGCSISLWHEPTGGKIGSWGFNAQVDIVFVGDNTQNRVVVDSVVGDIPWSEIGITIPWPGECNEGSDAYLYASGDTQTFVAHEAGGITIDTPVAEGDYIQVYPSSSGCNVDLWHDQGTYQFGGSWIFYP